MAIKYIYHTADWHLMPHNKHENFIEATNLFVDDIKLNGLQYDEAIICVLGDLFNEPTSLTIEMYDIMIDLLHNLIELHPVIIIGGNHDINVKNVNNVDIISPIVSAIRHPHLHYLKESKVYELYGINFANYSIFEPTIKPIITTNENLTVGLYHGQIQGAEVDGESVFNEKMKDFNINLSYFDGCAIVLMGDIHQAQAIISDNIIAAYCGSLFQQHYKESISNHGYLLWDLYNKSFVLKTIPSPHIYYKYSFDKNTNEFTLLNK